MLIDNNNFDLGKKNFEEGIKSFLKIDLINAEIFFFFFLHFVPDRVLTLFYLIQIYVIDKNSSKFLILFKKYKHLSNSNEYLFGEAYKWYFKKNYYKSIEVCLDVLKEKNLKYENQVLLLLAINYRKKKLFHKAFNLYRNILKNDKKNYSALYNVSTLLSEVGKIKRSYYYLKKALSLSPGNKNALWDMSLCLLSMGNLKEGFALYENRFERKQPQTRKFSKVKLLKNLQDLNNKTLLVWEEQGLGDTILFSRFVIKLLNYTDNISFVINKKLKNLFSNFDKKITMLEEEEINEKLFDYQIPIGSIPKLLNIEQKNQIPFYPIKILSSVNNELNFSFNPNKLNIGIATKGNPNYFLDEYRSTSLNNFNDLTDNKNFNIYNLSKGLLKKEFLDHKNLQPFDGGELNFYELSIFLKKLDIIISVDTAIVHLCGILGINCILILNYNSHWIWFNETNYNIWYPSIRIIKQKKFNDWKSLNTDLKMEIDKFYKKKFN